MIGRVASDVSYRSVLVRPTGPFLMLKSGDEIQFVASNGTTRAGMAVVLDADPETNWATFEMNLNAMVPAVIEGDSVVAYERPCSRCKCAACDIPIAQTPVSCQTLPARGMPDDLVALEAAVGKMRALGVTKWNGIELGPVPAPAGTDDNEPSESQVTDPKEQRAKRERVASLASGGPVKLGDGP